MLEKIMTIKTDGTGVAVYDDNNVALFSGGSLRDATEAVEALVLEAQYHNGVGNFNPDHTISAMVVNQDIRSKMQHIIDTVPLRIK